jgi:hypothetical protein
VSRVIPLVLLVALASPALADRVILKDGPTFEGTVSEKDGFYEIATKGKIVRVPSSSVARIESDEAPERIREIKILLDGAARNAKKRPALPAALAAFHDSFVIPTLCERVEKASSSEERRLAAQLLATRGVAVSVRALARAVVLDDVAAVRSQAMESLRRIGDPETGVLFVQALGRSSSVERTRATAALATFPRKEAVGALAALPNPAGNSSGGGTPRAHIFVGTERAYISGYELSAGSPGGFPGTIAEVAKPTVDVLRDGVVLEVASRYITVYETYVRVCVLRFLSGQMFASVQYWRDWWEKSKATFELAPPAQEQLTALKGKHVP